MESVLSPSQVEEYTRSALCQAEVEVLNARLSLARAEAALKATRETLAGLQGKAGKPVGEGR